MEDETMLTTEQAAKIYDLASQVDGEYVKPLLELSGYLDTLTGEQPQPEPTQELVGDPLFDAILGAIMQWDFSRFDDGMYAEATNNDARSIYDAIKAVLDRQQPEPIAWTTRQELDSMLSEDRYGNNRFAIMWRSMGDGEPWKNAIPLYTAPQLGTIAAEEHKRVMREAVKAAYERAAEKCAETHDFHIRGSCKGFEDGYSEGCNSCKDAIRALGESNAE